MDTVNLLCMKWGRKYPAEFVNRLHGMVSRNLTLPHRFVCLTDDPTGLNPGIEAFPIPEMPVDVSMAPNRFWTKIMTFADPLYDLQGLCLFLDLDIVIVDSIDPFFTHEGEFIISPDWNKDSIQRGTGNSSVFRYRVGSHSDVLRELVDRWEEVCNVQTHQRFISEVLLRQGVMTYWPEPWCISFKKHCCYRFPESLFRVPRCPEGARIVLFHGRPNPDEAIAGRGGSWYRFVRPTHWIAEHWR